MRAAADTFRANPGVDVATVITELKIGEALVSLLQPDGSPTPVSRTLIKAPASRVGPVTPVERGVLVQTDAIGTRYDSVIDRESAEEILAAKTAQATAAAAQQQAETVAEKEAAAQAKADAIAAKETARQQAAAQKEADRAAANSPRSKIATSATRAAGSSIGRQVANEIGKQVFGSSRRRSSSGGGIVGSVLRGVLGGLLRGR